MKEYEEMISKQTALAYAIITYKRFKTQVRKKERTYQKFCEEYIATTRKYKGKVAINIANKILEKEGLENNTEA